MVIQIVSADVETMATSRRALHDAGYDVRVALSLSEALWQVQKLCLPCLALIDTRLRHPDDAFRLGNIIHQCSDVPLILVSGVEQAGRVPLHVETCLRKPLRPAELLRQVGDVLQRVGGRHFAPRPLLRVDDGLQVDFFKRHLLAGESVVSLSPMEARLLYVLLRNIGAVVATDHIARRLWPGDGVNKNRVSKSISGLRQKLRACPTAAGRRYVFSERGVGYGFARF